MSLRAALAALALVATARPALAQHPQTREGVWFSAGLGYGSLGCSDCGHREGGLSGGFAVGGTVSPHLLLGVGTNGWTKSEQGVTLSTGVVALQARYYPTLTSGFFLVGGLGYGRVEAYVPGFGTLREDGPGAVIGGGYDIRVGRMVSITPFLNGFAISEKHSTATVGQVGIGITVH